MHKSRFLKIIDFVEDIPEEHFDMDNILKNIPDNVKSSDEVVDCLKNHCGSVGCVVGYLPMIFPKHWKYFPTLVGVKVKMRENRIDNHYDRLSDFLNIDYGDYIYLFMGGCEDTTIDFLDENPNLKCECPTKAAAQRTKEEQIQVMKDFYEYKTGEKYLNIT